MFLYLILVFLEFNLMQLMHFDLYALKNLLDFSSKCYLFSISVGFVIVTLKYFFSFSHQHTEFQNEHMPL